MRGIRIPRRHFQSGGLNDLPAWLQGAGGAPPAPPSLGPLPPGAMAQPAPGGPGGSIAPLAGGGPGSTLNQAAAPNPAALQQALQQQLRGLGPMGGGPGASLGPLPPGAGGPGGMGAMAGGPGGPGFGPPPMPGGGAIGPLPPGAGGPPPMPMGGPGVGPGGAPPAAAIPPSFGGTPLGPAGMTGAMNPSALRGAMMRRRMGMAAPAAASPMGAGFAKGGSVKDDPESDTLVKKRRPDRQWGDIAKTAEDLPPLKKAKGGKITRKHPKIAGFPKKKPPSTPNPYDYEDDEGTAPPQSMAAAPPAAPPPGPAPAPAGMKKGGKWIGKAIKKPGALHKQLGVPQGEKIPAKKLAAAADKGGKLGQRARLAEKLGKMKKSGGGKCDDKMATGGTVKLAKGGAAKQRKGYPNTVAPPKKLAKGGSVRGCGVAKKGCGFAGIF